MSFYFIGKGPLSKSLLNRALIVKSWFPEFQIEGSSHCDDIQVMEKIVHSIKSSKTFDCHLSATAFRFLALRLSREKGDFLLTGQEALWKRPFQDLPILLAQLGSQISKTKQGWSLSSQGWNPQGDYINIPSQLTSQYASAFVLNSWNYSKDIFFTLTSRQISYAYFQMTIDFVRKLGMEIKQSGKEFFIPKNQTLKNFNYKPEQDKSCLFALAALAALNGKVIFRDWDDQSLQPDSVFLDFLKDMGIPIEWKDNHVSIFPAQNLQPLVVNLSNYPDLFPVLSILCAKANGISELSGLSQQAFKESHRLNKVKELLNHLNIQVETKKTTLFIHGTENWKSIPPFSFNASNDHRMVMAAQVVKNLKIPIDIQGIESVKKSFPEFLSLVEGC